MTEAAKIGIQLVFWAGLAFPVVVGTFWPWWKTQLGWSIAAKGPALSAAVLLAVIFIYFGPRVGGDLHWLSWVGIGALYLVPAILIWRAVLIWLYQRGDIDLPRRPEAPREED